MLRNVKAAVLWSVIAFALAGCAQNAQGDIPNWLKGLLLAAFGLAAFCVVIAIVTKDAERRKTAGLAAFVTMILGVLFVLLLIA